MMMATRRLNGHRGSALISVLLIGVLLITSMIWFERWSSQNKRVVLHNNGSRLAWSQAENGVDVALQWLRNPANLSNLPNGGSYTLTPAELPTISGGRSDLTLYRNLVDASLVEAWSTSYFFLGSGSVVDPVSGKTAQMTVIHATIRARFVGDYFAAVPGALQLGYGTDASSGSVYARDLTFLPPNGSAQPTRVLSAYYLNSVSPDAAPSFVTFGGAPYQAQRLASEPGLVQLDSTLSAFYKALAGTDVKAAGSTLTGTLGAPSNQYHVYFCPGNLTLGSGASSLTVAGPEVVYATGSITINGNILTDGQPNSWLAVLCEGNVTIASTAGASSPYILTLNGTFVMGGQFQAAGLVRSTGSLIFNGGFLASGVNFASVWPQRTYSYTRAPANMLLPFFIAVEQYQVVRGGYNG
jgi:hypothetical protein